MNANLGQQNTGLKISSLTNSSTDGSAWEHLLFLLAALSHFQPCCGCHLPPILSYSSVILGMGEKLNLTLMSLTVVFQLSHANCPYQTAAWMKPPSIYTWVKNLWGVWAQSGSKVMLLGSLSIWDVSTPCYNNGKGRGEGLQMRHQPFLSPTKYNHSQLQLLHAATWPEAAGRALPFSSPRMVPGVWSHPVELPEVVSSRYTQMSLVAESLSGESRRPFLLLLCSQGPASIWGEPKRLIHFRGGLQS